MEAFKIFHNETKIITFHEISNDSADILVGCSKDFVEVQERHFAAGEGGPSIIINTSGFKTIEQGKISLYKDQRCESPVVEIHELGHVFGFDHSENPKSIMYNISNCGQKITPDMIEIVNKLYSIEPLPDARISELVAYKKGRYLDFNITILNDGLLPIENISLSIFSGEDEDEIEKIDLGRIGIGFGRTLRATNIKLSSRNDKEIKFVVDHENKVKEFRENNNEARMIIQTT
jgi:hypothetical protein